MTKLTSTYIGRRVKKSEYNKQGWIDDVVIDKNDVCILILGGSGTDTSRAANGYAKQIEKLLINNDLNDKVKIFSAYYNFDFEIAKASRNYIMDKYGRKQNEVRFYDYLYPDLAKNKYDTPRYIKILFEKTILPRISENNKKIDINDALKNIRKINIIAHCHGGYVAMLLENLMQSKMQELNYSKDEILKIQEQFLILGLAPYAPLGISKSTFISFASINDTVVEHGNFFHQYMKKQKNNPDFPISFFEKDKGNFFLVKQIAKVENNKPNTFLEHSFFEIGYDEYTSDGILLNELLDNITINSLSNSLKQDKKFTPLPDIKELSGNKKLFNKALSNGNKQFKLITDAFRLSTLSKERN